MKTHFRAFLRSIGAGSLVPFVVFLGCQPSRPRTDQKVFDQNLNALVEQFDLPYGEIPQEVLDKVPVYLASLKPGMSPTEVLQTLRLRKAWLVAGNHAPWAYDLDFRLRSNCQMTLCFNMLSNPPSFLKASLYGDGWKQSPTNGLSQ